MTSTLDYIAAFKDVCKQANSTPYSPQLQAQSPGTRVDDRFEVLYDARGLCTLIVEPILLGMLEAELKPLIRIVLRRILDGGRFTITFYPVANAQLQ